ncbi:MAG: very short patch repair endonuclease [Desulfarculaceae bacterium]|nr:very short patch repair endonuclease [Desulfarculaceae bacterium]
MTDHLTKKQRSHLMASIHSTDTRPELIVRKLLHSMGFRFRLHRKDLPGKPDIVLPKYSTVIFVHGCFWHQHKNCKDGRIPETNRSFWETKLKTNVSRDANNVDKLKRMGWNVLIIWQCQLNNLSDLANFLQKELKNQIIS